MLNPAPAVRVKKPSKNSKLVDKPLKAFSTGLLFVDASISTDDEWVIALCAKLPYLGTYQEDANFVM